jgi:predicted Zn-dependent protease with MMP-like domain
MADVSDETFETMVAEAVDDASQKHGNALKNVIFVVEDQPSQVQREKLHLRGDQTLYGLYEGVPLTRRGSGMTFLLPDKITLFRGPLKAGSFNLLQLRDAIRHTVWHEVGHYFGLDHADIDRLDRKRVDEPHP